MRDSYAQFIHIQFRSFLSLPTQEIANFIYKRVKENYTYDGQPFMNPNKMVKSDFQMPNYPV